MKRAHVLLIPACALALACPDAEQRLEDAGVGPEDAAPILELDAGVGADAEAPDAGEEELVLCGADHPWPEDNAPVAEQTLVQTLDFGFPLNTTALVLEGPRRYRMPGSCVFLAEPGHYVARLFASGVEVASGELDFAAERSVIIALAGHPMLGTRIEMLDWDFSPIGEAAWRMQFLNLAPETAGGSMLIYAYPPGTPRTGAAGATPTLVTAVDYGESSSVLVPQETDLFAFVPSTSSATIANAALPALPCGAEHATEAFIIWCDTVPESGDPGGPCAATLGAHIFLHTLHGQRCF
jgi:hypothetical protein